MMACEEIKELLYEFVTERLQEDEQRRVQQHLESCENCRREAEEMAHTVKLLDTVKPPPISADFKERVLRRVDGLPLPSKPVWQRIKEYLLPSSSPTLLKGLAVTMILLIAVSSIYLIPEILQRRERWYRGEPKPISSDFLNVPNPIILEVDDIEQESKYLVGLIQQVTYNDTKPGEEREMLFRVKQDEEQALLEYLDKSGAAIPSNAEDYKDENGDIALILKKRERNQDF